MFTSIIEFTIPRNLSFSIRLLEKGSEGSTYGVSFKEKLSGHPSRLNGSGRCRETDMEDWDAHAGYTGPIMNVGPGPRMDIFGKGS